MTHNHVSRVSRSGVRAENLAKEVLDAASVRITDIREGAKARSQALLEKVKDRGSDLLDEARERGSEFLDEAQDRGEKALKTSGEWIGDNPAMAVGIAFAAGMIAWAWFRRGDD